MFIHFATLLQNNEKFWESLRDLLQKISQNKEAEKQLFIGFRASPKHQACALQNRYRTYFRVPQKWNILAARYRGPLSNYPQIFQTIAGIYNLSFVG